MKTFLYNTTKAYYKCSLGNRLCSLKLFLLRANAAVLTSPGPRQVKDCHLLTSTLLSIRVITLFFLNLCCILKDMFLNVLNGLLL